jgi:hypothetical protein
MRRVVSALLITLLAGCNDELAWSLPNEALVLQGPGRSCTISPDSPQYKNLSAWVSRNRSEWSSSPASYVPGIIVRGSNFTINFLDSVVVVNHAGGQFTHRVSPSEFAFLSCSSGT